MDSKAFFKLSYGLYVISSRLDAVSYTHLDVYKRQLPGGEAVRTAVHAAVGYYGVAERHGSIESGAD